MEDFGSICPLLAIILFIVILRKLDNRFGKVEKELDEVLEIVQRPVPVKNTGREETVSLQENLQENDPLQEEMQIETEKEEKEEKEDSPESAAKEQNDAEAEFQDT